MLPSKLVVANTVSISVRDRSLLKLLSWTPATTALLYRASVAFDDGPFLDERRLRERLQALSKSGYIRIWSTAHAGGGLQNYYKLTLQGFQVLHGMDIAAPPRSFFAEISPALFQHTLRLADVIVETARACHVGRITIDRFYRENELKFTSGAEQVQPDCFIRFLYGGRPFHVAYELDQSTESLDSNAANSIRTKLRIYHSYQDTLLDTWEAHGRTWERPRFRVAFLTPTIDRAHHILALSQRMAVHKSRRLVYAATYDSYVGESDPIRTPLFLDHDGHWQALVDLHPTANFLKSQVRIRQDMEPMLPF